MSPRLPPSPAVSRVIVAVMLSLPRRRAGLFATGGRDITKTADESSKVIKLLSRIQHRKASLTHRSPCHCSHADPPSRRPAVPSSHLPTPGNRCACSGVQTRVVCSVIPLQPPRWAVRWGCLKLARGSEGDITMWLRKRASQFPEVGSWKLEVVSRRLILTCRDQCRVAFPCFHFHVARPLSNYSLHTHSLPPPPIPQC